MAEVEGKLKYGFYVKPVPPAGWSGSIEIRAMGRHEGWTAEPWFGVDGGKLPYPVYMKLGRDREGRLAVMGLHVDGLERWREYGPPAGPRESITAASLRLVGSAVMDVLRSIAEHGFWDDPTMDLVIGPLLDRSAEPYAGVALRPGRGGHPDEFYREVAEAYAELQGEGVERRHRVKILSEKLYRTPGQTRRLVYEAWRRFPEMKPKEGAKP